MIKLRLIVNTGVPFDGELEFLVDTGASFTTLITDDATYKNYPGVETDGQKEVQASVFLLGNERKVFVKLMKSPYPGYHHMLGMDALRNFAVFMHAGKMVISAW